MIAAASALASRFAVATALDRIAPARVDARGRDAIERGRDGEPRREGGGGGDHVARACADDDAMAMTSKR